MLVRTSVFGRGTACAPCSQLKPVTPTPDSPASARKITRTGGGGDLDQETFCSLVSDVIVRQVKLQHHAFVMLQHLGNLQAHARQ